MIDSFKFENMGFGYDDQLPLFENVSLELPKDRNVHVRTKSGGGRSTVLKLISGMLLPSHGDYIIDGKSVYDMSFEEFLPFRLAIGYGFDLGGLLSNKSLSENLLLPLEYHRPKTIEQGRKRVNELLDIFGLYPDRDKRPAAVTGAKRKSCCVARAFVLEPTLLLLDDPTEGLPPEINETLIFVVNLYRKEHGLRHMFFTSNRTSLIEGLDVLGLDIDQRNLVVQNTRAA